MLTPKTAQQVWAVVMGSATTGPIDQVTDISQASDADQFDGNLAKSIKVLLRYGASVMAVRLPNPDFGILSTLEADTGRFPVAVVLPATSDGIGDFAAACQAAGLLGIVDYIGSTNGLLNARLTNTGYGTKSPNLAITFPAVTKGEDVEFLSCHLGGLICKSVQLDSLVSGEVIRGATAVTVAINPTDSDQLVQHGVITVDNFTGPVFCIRGFSNSMMDGTSTQDTALMRPVTEGLITRDVQRFLASRIGSQANLSIARGMASEISVYLAGRQDIAGGSAVLDESASTFTATSAHLVYRLNVSLLAGFTITSVVTFEP